MYSIQFQDSDDDYQFILMEAGGDSPICAHSGSYPQKLTKQPEWAWAKYKYLHILDLFLLTKLPEWAWAKMSKIEIFAHYICFDYK